MWREVLFLKDTSIWRIKRQKRLLILLRNSPNFSQVVAKSKSTTLRFHKMLSFHTSTVTHWTTLTTWPFGKHSLVTSLTLLKSPLILSWPTVKTSGWDKTPWRSFFHMDTMGLDLNTAAVESKDSYNWPILMARFLTRDSRLTNQSHWVWILMSFGRTFNPLISHSFSPQNLPTCSML